MRLEEYILKRKTEDGINEFNRNKRDENARICVQYIDDYFNRYLVAPAGEEKTSLHDEKIKKYANIVKKYSEDIQEWLIDMYSSYGKYLYRTLPAFINDPFFLLYDSESEFRALLHDIYPKIIKKYNFLDGHSEMVYRFFKDEYRIRSIVTEEDILPNITKSINDWMSETYQKHGVNIYSFCWEYLLTFMDNPDRWPREHKKRSKDYDKYKEYAVTDKVFMRALYDYDFKQKNNLFDVDTLFRAMPMKEFIKGKKQEFEAVLLYCYCHGWDSQALYWEEYLDRLPF